MSIKIEVLIDPLRIMVNGLQILNAPTIAELYDVLGEPTRFDTGERPAPLGFRNSQRHIYDESGVVFLEHHYTRRAEEICVWYNVVDTPFPRFTPRKEFTGRLLFQDIDMPHGGDVLSFVQQSPLILSADFGGVYEFHRDGLITS